MASLGRELFACTGGPARNPGEAKIKIRPYREDKIKQTGLRAIDRATPLIIPVKDNL
jgi:hypothetical protein